MSAYIGHEITVLARMLKHAPDARPGWAFGGKVLTDYRMCIFGAVR
jgi:hypothetical protein